MIVIVHDVLYCIIIGIFEKKRKEREEGGLS